MGCSSFIEKRLSGTLIKWLAAFLHLESTVLHTHIYTHTCGCYFVMFVCVRKKHPLGGEERMVAFLTLRSECKCPSSAVIPETVEL